MIPSEQPIETPVRAPTQTPKSPAIASPPTVQSFGLTDRGRKRDTNQDQFLTATLMRALWIQQSSVNQAAMRYGDDRGHVFIVADGMGGAVGGNEASTIALGAVEEFLLNALRWVITLSGPEDATVLRDFRTALRSADECVYAAAENNPHLKGMGTTLTMAYSRGSELFLAHVGDSRCYLLRGTLLYRLTRDDTMVQQLLETGAISPEAALKHTARHIITNVVGGGPNPGVKVQVHRMHIEAGDTILLCTDGLTGMLSDHRISTIMQGSRSPQDACEQLIRGANEQGGDDNITAVVARYR